MIRLDHISYWYPKGLDAALRDISLQIDAGEAVCVMGRNGSGKSTLVKLLAGLIKPDRGQVSINGIEAADDSRPGQVGLLFQNPDNQMVATLVDKEIAFALENQAVPLEEMKSEIARIAGQFGIEHLLGRLTSELSGGEKQRVALASVMIQNPAMLLLDEPDSFLDQKGRSILATELTQIRSQNPDLVELRVTQSVEVARSYNRLIILDEGRVAVDCLPGTVLNDRDQSVKFGLTLPESPRTVWSAPDFNFSHPTGSKSRVGEVRFDKIDYAWPMHPPVFQNLSFSLRSGETVALVGPTGAGKSSVGLLLAGLAEPTSGAISYLDGSGRALEVAARRGEVALVLQQPERQFFLDSCADEIAFGPSNLGRPLPKGEIDRLLDAVGLAPTRFADRDPFSLSAGEKRRLAFAAVLAMAPSMIFFDEPTAGLDGAGIGRFVCLSQALKESGLGQLIVSHDGDIIRHLADRVLYLTAQADLLQLSPQELLDSPDYASVVSPPTGAD
jgi:energy-coupling factor transport system ATP-binding protein